MSAPFLKWAGGKGQLLEQLIPMLPPSFKNYVEPFLGGGAMLFELRERGLLRGRVHASDINRLLIITYRVVRDAPEELLDRLAWHQERHSEMHYYWVRGWDRDFGQVLDPVPAAARMIYINRTCYNGVWRVNRKNQVNIPIGSYDDPEIVRSYAICPASEALQGAELSYLPFWAAVQGAEEGDFVYFDPPYVPRSKTARYTGYTPGGFGPEDHRHLRHVVDVLTERGVYVMLSNSYMPFVAELFAGYRLDTVSARRAVNSKASKRGDVREYVVRNY